MRALIKLPEPNQFNYCQLRFKNILKRSKIKKSQKSQCFEEFSPGVFRVLSEKQKFKIH